MKNKNINNKEIISNITPFQSKGQKQMKQLLEESTKRQIEYQACLSRVQMKFDNCGKVTERDIDSILSNMENLTDSYFKQKNLSEEMGYEMSDEEKKDLDKAVREGVAEGYGFEVIK